MIENDLSALKMTLEKIPLKDVKRPIIPVNVFIQEAHDLYVWILEDEAALLRAGLDQTLYETLPKRIDALQQAQSHWIRSREDRKSFRQKHEKIKLEAEKIKRDLVATFRFAFRNDPHIQMAVNKIVQGTSNHDLTQDLSDLVVIAEDNIDGLKAIGYETQTIKQASGLVSKLANATALWNVQKKSTDARELRDRAYSYLSEAVDAIRVTGRYVFRENPIRIVGYRHRYRARK
ncbi:MAG: hypothetical protein ACFHWX_00470 [Bacteroidota bacterium]